MCCSAEGTMKTEAGELNEGRCRVAVESCDRFYHPAARLSDDVTYATKDSHGAWVTDRVAARTMAFMS
jgi:hypothetical protein